MQEIQHLLPAFKASRNIFQFWDGNTFQVTRLKPKETFYEMKTGEITTKKRREKNTKITRSKRNRFGLNIGDATA